MCHLVVDLVYFVVVVMHTDVASRELKPFYLRFIGEDSAIAFSEEQVSLGHAVNQCVKICKEIWWCNALRKCADSRLSFRCHVTCQLQKYDVDIPKPVNEKCVLLKTNRIGPNVAANQDVEIIHGNAYLYLKEQYATDGVTICPLNNLFLHTQYTYNPWIKIFFHQAVDVALIVVYNRQLQSGSRFHDALMQVANGDVWTTCGFYKGPGEDFQIIFTICNDVVRGDTLMIAIQSNNSNESIQVCEVEVFEKI